MSPASAAASAGLRMVFGSGSAADTAIDRLDAHFPQGRISGLVGPDGSGKSTLLRILAGLLRPSEGQALVFGRPAADQTGQIGYMPQHFGLYEALSVRANLRLQARLRGIRGENEPGRAARLLAFTGLGPFQERLAGALSGGMKQKLGIACTLMGSPRLLLLDEPGVGVDPVSRRELWAMVQELKDGGMTVIWATAYMEEAQRFPHIVMLEQGQSIFQGEPKTLQATARGRVFLLPAGAAGGRHARSSLLDWSTRPGVCDALVQGPNLRLTLAVDAPRELSALVRAGGARAAEPALEDAYMTLAGGISHDPSPFATLFSARPGPESGAPKILCENLTRKFGSFTVARDVSLMVRAGEIFGLMGPNGAGKSTTFQMLCGLLRPSSGQCFVDGVNLLNAGSQARARLGYMAQKFSLYPDLRAWTISAAGGSSTACAGTRSAG